jgi:hypothetical protein
MINPFSDAPISPHLQGAGLEASKFGAGGNWGWEPTMADIPHIYLEKIENGLKKDNSNGSLVESSKIDLLHDDYIYELADM